MIFAIPADAVASPPKPRKPAMRAMTNNQIAALNIPEILRLKLFFRFVRLLLMIFCSLESLIKIGVHNASSLQSI